MIASGWARRATGAIVIASRTGLKLSAPASPPPNAIVKAAVTVANATIAASRPPRPPRRRPIHIGLPT